MKRGILLLITSLLVACGGESEPPATATTVAQPTATAPPATATPSAVPSAATPTRPADEPTPPPAPPSATASPTTTSVPATQAPVSRSSSPLTGQVTLAPAISLCVGEGLFVADDGDTVYTLGQRDGQPCASAIDLTAGDVKSAEPSALPLPLEDALQVSDPARGRVYSVENGVVNAYDADGQTIGPVLTLPPGEPEGFSAPRALRLFVPPAESAGEIAGRLYLSYEDFDGQAWIALADLASGKTITDVPVPRGPWALSADGGLIFANTTTLVVLDGATLEVTGRLSLSHRPTSAVADPGGERLFVADAGGDLYVLDPLTLTEGQRLPGLGSAVDLDPRLGQLYVGDRYSGGIHVFDLHTLEALGRIPQPGQPVASPADGLVYILEEDVYQADGATLQVLVGRTTRNNGCNGCAFPTGVVVDPNTGLTHVTRYHVWVGKPGRTSEVAVDPLTGRAFVALTTGGYQVGYSLALYPDLSLVEPTRWVDGLYGQPLYNPVSDQLYLAHGGRLLVLDGQSLELLGALPQPDLELLAVDGRSGQLYVAQGEQLVRMAAELTFPDAPAPEPVAGLPGPVYGIAVSPAFAQDSTLFARATDWESGRTGFYRSRDAGSSWVRPLGGLPGSPNDLVFAPDGRLYAALVPMGWQAMPEAATWGEGVYVSEDGGDTWRPDNRGLTHLRVGRLHVADDGTLHALAASAVEPGSSASAPTIWRRPPGQDWTLHLVPEAGPLRMVDYTIPTTYTQAIRAYWHTLTGGGPLYQGWGGELQRSDDGGRSWQAVGLSPAAYANEIVRGSDGVYWIGPGGLWRTTDEGATWAALRHPALGDEELYEISVNDVGGVETLFLGTKTSQVLIVPVSEAEWEEPSPPPTLTPLPPMPSPTAMPKTCELSPAPPFAAAWDDPARKERLGCPLHPAEVHAMAYQLFENGVMIWEGAALPSIYVGLAAGDWVNQADLFQAGDPESDPTLTPPDGLLQPVRGFGLLWRSDESLRQALGWASAPETGFEGTAQAFEGGYAIANPDGLTWFFYAQGTPLWESLNR